MVRVVYPSTRSLILLANKIGDGFSVRRNSKGLAEYGANVSDINLPTGGIAFACLFFTLKLNPTKKHTFAQFKQTFDFLGLQV